MEPKYTVMNEHGWKNLLNSLAELKAAKSKLSEVGDAESGLRAAMDKALRELEVVWSVMRRQCQVGWVNQDGDPTFDHDPAVATVECRSPEILLTAASEADIVEYPICEHHLQQVLDDGKAVRVAYDGRRGGMRYWHPSVTDFTPPHLSTEIAHHQATHHPLSHVVVHAVAGAFPRDTMSILHDLRWNSLEGYWYFRRWGMHVGVETDGFIHS